MTMTRYVIGAEKAVRDVRFSSLANRLTRRWFLSAASIPAALTAPSAHPQITSVAALRAGYSVLQRAGIVFGSNEALDIARLSERHILILNFWTYWCPYCRQEFDGLQKVQARFGNNNIMVVLVSEQKNWERDVAAARKLGIDWRMAYYKDAIGFAAKAQMLGGRLDGDTLHYHLPCTWIVLNDRPQTMFVGDPDWAEGEGARFVEGYFK